jgi:hypothetical protein
MMSDTAEAKEGKDDEARVFLLPLPFFCSLLGYQDTIGKDSSSVLVNQQPNTHTNDE